MGCPSEEELVELVEGRMSAVTAKLESHLDACATCHAIVVAAASLEPDAGGVAGARYDILGEIGHGGQSRVFRAFDRELGRVIALKQFTPTAAAHSDEGPSPVDRCLREVRVTAALSHPAILPIHDMGLRPTGVPYYTMPLVDGSTLDDVVARTPTVRRRLRLLSHVITVCQAMAYAHDKGIVHRDIKPANIMVGGFGQTLLVDWGLARLPEGIDRPGADADGCATSTIDGSIMGTPAYMSPEQAAGDTAAIGPHSDVWSLGAVLYFVLCGRAPFGTEGLDRTLRQVRHALVWPVTAPDGEVPAELVAIVRRAMAAAPQDRYPSAAALADDLIAFQCGAEVRSYSYRTSERALRFARRHRWLLFGAAVVVVALGVITTILALSYRAEARAHARTDEALARAEVARARAEQLAAIGHRHTVDAHAQVARAHIDAAESERTARRPLTARLYAASSLFHNPTYASSPNFEASASMRPAGGDELIARAMGQLALSNLDVVEGVSAPPGPWIADPSYYDADFEGRLMIVADHTEVARVLAIDTGAVITRLADHDGEVVYVLLSPAGRWALTQDEAGVVRRWRLPEGTLEGTWPAGAKALPRAAVADDGAIAFKGKNGAIVVVHADGRAASRELAIDEPKQLRFSDDSRWLAIAASPGEVVLVDAATAREAGRVAIGPTQGSMSLAFSHDGAQLVASRGNELTFIDRATRTVRGTVRCRGAARAVAMSPDDRLVLVAMSNNAAIIDAADRLVLAELPSEIVRPYWVWATADRLFVSGVDRAAAWTLRAPAVLPGVPEGSRVVDLDGPVFHFTRAAGGDEVRALDWATGQLGVEVVSGPAPIVQVQQSGPGILTLHEDGTVAAWTRTAGRWTMTRSQRFDPDLRCIAASAAGDRAAAWEADGTITVFGLDDAAAPPLVLDGSRPPHCSTLRFSPDGEALTAGLGELRVWDLQRPNDPPMVVRAGVDGEQNTDVAFGRSSERLYVAGDFGVRELMRDGSLGRSFTRIAHTAVRHGDGLLLAQRGRGELDVFDVDNGRSVLSIRAHGPHAFHIAAIEPGGEAVRLVGTRAAYRLAVGEHEDADAGALLDAAEEAAGHTVDAHVAAVGDGDAG